MLPLDPADGPPGVQPGASTVPCRVKGSGPALVSGCGRTAARDRARLAVRTAAEPAQVNPMAGRCAASASARAPAEPRLNICLRVDGVRHEHTACRKHSCASRPGSRHSSQKPYRGGGGSHRRSRAEKTAALRDVATKTQMTTAPWRSRLNGEKAPLAPYPRAADQLLPRPAPHAALSRGVQGLALGLRLPRAGGYTSSERLAVSNPHPEGWKQTGAQK